MLAAILWLVAPATLPAIVAGVAGVLGVSYVLDRAAGRRHGYLPR